VTRALVVVAIVIASSRSAAADPKAEARAHMERATAAHKAGKFDEALAELTRAYASDPQPGLLYAIGQVHVKLGNCAAAITYYRKFLATNPKEADAAIVEQAIDKCDSVAPTKPTPEPPPSEPAKQPAPASTAAAPTPVAPPVEEPAPSSGASPWYRDLLGNVLVGGGVLALAASGLVYRDALRAHDGAADAATSYQDYVDRLDKAERQRTYSYAIAAGGVLLVGTGILRYALRDGGQKAEHVGVVPARGGGVVTWSTRFSP
jgi:tetratricopeptide (TPR) repeat protein